MPEVKNSQELYQFYKSHQNPDIQDDINLDIPRTDKQVIEFENLQSRPSKILFNILNAYANLNKQIGFCQGMAFIASWILKMLREVSYPAPEPQEQTDKKIDSEKIFLKYNEEQAFYIFCYIMDELNWSLIFEPSMERIMTYITNFEAVISGGYF